MLRGALAVGGCQSCDATMIEVALGHQPIDHRHDLVATGNRQIAIRAETVLHIDDQQSALARAGHVRRCAGAPAASLHR